MKRLIIFLALTSISLFISCSKGTLTENLPNDQSTYSVDTTIFSEVYAEARGIDGLYSLVVSRYGDIIYEKYFHGHDAEKVHDVRSVTKSLTSILIGIAIDKGFITGVNERMRGYIEPLVDDYDKYKTTITIEHLLTMSAGFEWTPIGDWSEYNNWISASDQINYVMNKPIVTVPGAEFNYNDGASHLLSVILTEATGLSAKEFAEKYLFNYLEIGDRPWSTDNRGYNLGNVAVELTSRDMIKLGNLFLYNGVWNSQRVVSGEWIEQSTKYHISTGIGLEYEKYYGYLWWVNDKGDHPYYFANGYGGQFIVVIPDLELVVVATNKWWNVGNKADEYWYRTITMIIENIIFLFD